MTRAEIEQRIHSLCQDIQANLEENYWLEGEIEDLEEQLQTCEE